MIAVIDKNGKVLRLKIGYTSRSIYDRMKELLAECKKETHLNRTDIELKLIDVFQCLD
jgi:hypothetical protein